MLGTKSSTVTSEELPADLRDGVLIIDAEKEVKKLMGDNKEEDCTAHGKPEDIFAVMASVGMPYHEGAYLKSTLEQAIRQGFRNFKIIESGYQQWRTIKMLRDIQDDKQAEVVAIQEGAEWCKKVRTVCSELEQKYPELKDKIQIVVWPQPKDIPDYFTKRGNTVKKINEKEEKPFNQIAVQVKEAFEERMRRQLKKEEKVSAESKINHLPKPNQQSMSKSSGQRNAVMSGIKNYIIDERVAYEFKIFPELVEEAKKMNGKVFANYPLSFRSALVDESSKSLNTNLQLFRFIKESAGNPLQLVLTDTVFLARMTNKQVKKRQKNKWKSAETTASIPISPTTPPSLVPGAPSQSSSASSSLSSSISSMSSSGGSSPRDGSIITRPSSAPTTTTIIPVGSTSSSQESSPPGSHPSSKLSSRRTTPTEVFLQPTTLIVDGRQINGANSPVITSPSDSKTSIALPTSGSTVEVTATASTTVAAAPMFYIPAPSEPPPLAVALQTLYNNMTNPSDDAAKAFLTGMVLAGYERGKREGGAALLARRGIGGGITSGSDAASTSSSVSSKLSQTTQPQNVKITTPKPP
jgi:hypothetical protein